MTEPTELNYLSFEADFSTPEAVAAYDELPLWSAMAGLLLLNHVPMRREMRVLDIGCGTGFPLLELAGRLGPSSDVTGLDLWETALDRARMKAKAYGVEVEIRSGDAAAMPFAAASFDLIVSNLGINNFSDPEAALRECRRVLAPSGRLALTTNLQGHMQEFYDVFASTLAELGEGGLLDVLQRHVEHRASIARIEALFAHTGFRVARVEHDSASLRFADGSAMLRHYFIRLGFLGAWKDVVPAGKRDAVFSELESRLNGIASTQGDIALTIPLAYIEGEPV